MLVAVVAGVLMGCNTPILEPLPTYTPYPTPEARVVVATPTPSPAKDGMCFNAKIEIVQGTVWDGSTKVYAVGNQIICAKEWQISHLYGPVGDLDENPDKPLTFRDLRESVERYKKPLNNH